MCYALRECWFQGCHNPAFQPTKCDAGKHTPCSGWLIRVGEPSQDVFCDEHIDYFNPTTLADERPKDSKHPNPHLGAFPTFNAHYLDTNNTGQAQSYNGSNLPPWQSLQPSAFTDALVPNGPYSSVVTHDGTILTHPIPGGLHATGPIPNPLPPWYVDEDMTSDIPLASNDSNDVPEA